MVPYLIFYSLLLLLSALYKIKKDFLIVYFFCFTIFYSFAINIGPDWYNYYEYFQHLSDLDFIWQIPTQLPENEARFEWGFHVLSFLLTRFGFNYNFIIVSFNTISFFVYRKVFKEIFGNDYLYCFTFFIIFYGNRLFLSTLRQNLSVCFFYLCIVQFLKNDKKAFVSFVLSFLFHSTGILVLFPIIIYKIITKKNFLLISIILFFLSLIGFRLGSFLPKVILALFSNFIPTAIQRIVVLLVHSEPRVRDYLSILQFLLIVSMVLILPKKILEKKESRVLISLVILSFIMKFHFTNIPLLSARLKYNLGLGYIYVTYLFIRENQKVLAFKILTLCYSLLLWGYSFTVVKEDYVCYVPYDNIFVQMIKYINQDDYIDMTKFNARLKIIRNE